MDRKHVPHVPTITLALAMAVLASSAARGSDGQLDTTFGAVRIAWDYGGSHNDWVSDVVADDSTDSLYLVGYLASETTDDDWGVVRIDAQGNQVRRRLFFDRGGTNDDFATAAYLDGNGHLLVAGWVTTSDTTADDVLCRLAADTLQPDSTFGTGGCASIVTGGFFQVVAVAPAGDGGHLVAGTFQFQGNYDFSVIKFTANGQLDTSFGDGGHKTVPWDLVPGGADSLYAMAVDRNSGILLAGEAQHPSYGGVLAIAKLTPGGQLDPAFGTGGKVSLSSSYPVAATAITVEPASGTNFLVAAREEHVDFSTQVFLIRFDGSGGQIVFQGSGDSQAEVTWSQGAGNYVPRILVQSDGKMVVAGDTASGLFYEITRLNPDGTPDPNFGANGTRSYEPLHNANPSGAGVAAATLSGGRVVVAGDVFEPDLNWLVIRLTNGLIFRDGFESDDTRLWSAF